jgi:hypothetical protein
MSDFIEWVPKHHGHKPLHWTPDMLTSVDGKNFVRQPSWSWIAGSTYYVPHEAVGVVREAVGEETGIDRKLLCAREALVGKIVLWPPAAKDFENVCVRAIELWEEGFGK